MKKLVWLLLPIVILVAIFSSGLTHSYPRRAVQILDHTTIGGLEQWFMAMGADEDLPVLLWLHGGPGAAQMPISRYYNHNLEDEFIVVHWDQRGAGKSNPADFAEDTMAVEQYVQDVLEMTDYLRNRFAKEKIFLLGHSWGSLIGMLAAAEAPNRYYAYIGVSQVVDSHVAQQIAYLELVRRMESAGSRNDLAELARLEKPPYTNHADYVEFAGWLDRYGMNMDASMAKLAWIALGSGIYRLSDFPRWLDGANRGSGPMWSETESWSMSSHVHSLAIPTYFFTGANDFNTPAPLTRDFVDDLPAPAKEFFLYNNAGHMPFISYPEEFFFDLSRIKESTFAINP